MRTIFRKFRIATRNIRRARPCTCHSPSTTTSSPPPHNPPSSPETDAKNHDSSGAHNRPPPPPPLPSYQPPAASSSVNTDQLTDSMRALTVNTNPMEIRDTVMTDLSDLQLNTNQTDVDRNDPIQVKNESDIAKLYSEILRRHRRRN